MKISFFSHHCIHHPLMLAIALVGYFGIIQETEAQTTLPYKAPQDTVSLKRSPDESLTTYHTQTKDLESDSRLIGMAMKAASILTDTTQYDIKQGILVERLFEEDDLEYVAKQGMSSIITLFELINNHLPKGQSITFRTEQEQNVTIGENPLVLKNLRAIVSAKPATIQSNYPQWKENVYQAYMARDYGTKLHNTITITSATREIRETPNLEIIDFNGNPITLGSILNRQLSKNKGVAEKMAVAELRAHTFPNERISKQNANENYRRTLLELIRLQEADINRHPETKEFVKYLTNDLRKGKNSNVINALRSSEFFNANVPGNLGPVLLTEDRVISADQVQNNAEAKAMELMMLTSLHYGERDAVKLLKRLINSKGSVPATETGDFTAKRLNELTDHGTEKLKSLGYGADKTKDMSSADLVLVAVAGPEAPVITKQKAFINLQQVGATIINQYWTVEEVQETENTVLFNPRIKIGSRHIEYRASFDPVDFVPQLVNGSNNPNGSRIVQNGIEVRIESDLYFSNAQKIFRKGVKPAIYPEFGIVAGAGRRSVGYDNSTTPGPYGAVPKFKQNYINWGGHIGLNAGPLLFGIDATVLSTPDNDDAYKRFFDLSHSMTYYRYSITAHLMNLGVGKIEQGKGANITLDAEFAGETNNEGTTNQTHTQGGASQIGSGEWQRDYDRAHPNGQYAPQIATEMIENGDVKASYAASNFAALYAGIQKSGFHLKAGLGLYNLKAIDGHDKDVAEWTKQLFKNTIKGHLFGTVGLTYNFNSRSKIEKYKKTESYQSTTGQGEQSPHQTHTSSSQESSFGPRDHAIFTNKKSRIKPREKEIKP